MNYSRGVSGTILAGFQIYICPEQNMMMMVLVMAISRWMRMLMMIRDGSRYQIGWIFGTIPNGLRPLPTFSENYIAFVFGKRPKKTFVKVQNLQHNFWNFSQKFILFGSVTRPLAGCQIYICPWQPVQNMISLVTWPRPSLGKTRIAFYFSYNFSPLSTNIFLVKILSMGWKFWARSRGAT